MKNQRMDEQIRQMVSSGDLDVASEQSLKAAAAQVFSTVKEFDRYDSSKRESSDSESSEGSESEDDRAKKRSRSKKKSKKSQKKKKKHKKHKHSTVSDSDHKA